jgi:microcystin-dependent protein
MGILWQSAPTPFIDPNGVPYAGAKAYFFDASTTTPKVVYRDAGLNTAHDHPVIAKANGMFDAIFLPPGDYRLRMETATGVTLWDTDGITTPGTGSSGGGGGGSSTEQTGDLKNRYGIEAAVGWVRCNGNTIGNTASGATNRANADCEALFSYLWNVDLTLLVTGGRGGSASADFAANKAIQTPDFRGRVLAGFNGMGAGPIPSFIDDGQVDFGETTNTIGATMGASGVRLTIADIPSHDHGGIVSGAGAHAHDYQRRAAFNADRGDNNWGVAGTALETATTSTVGDHAHLITAQGGGQFHLNMQPTAFISIHIKL